MARQVKIFSGTASRYLAEQITDCYGAPLGDVKVARFSDGSSLLLSMKVCVVVMYLSSKVLFRQLTTFLNF